MEARCTLTSSYGAGAVCGRTMRRRVVLVYGVGLTLIVHVVILAILSYNLTEYGPVAERDPEAAPWVARNTGAQRNIHLAQEGEQARLLSSFSHGSSVEHQEFRTLSPTLGRNTPPDMAADAGKLLHGLPADPVDREKASERTETKSRPALKKDVNDLISSERWKRLKPPSMLLEDKDERMKMELYAEAERQDSWRREQKRRSALADLEERGVREMPVAMQSKDKVAQRLISGKPEKARKPGDKVGGDNPMKAFIIDALAEEHKRAEELNEMWKKRRDKLESGKRLVDVDYGLAGIGGGDSSKLTVRQYFEQVCEEPPGPLVECYKTLPRKLSDFESSGGDIMLSIRTTLKYHDTRLPVLFDTWLGEVEPTNVFMVTDGEDEDLLWKTNTLGQWL